HRLPHIRTGRLPVPVPATDDAVTSPLPGAIANHQFPATPAVVSPWQPDTRDIDRISLRRYSRSRCHIELQRRPGTGRESAADLSRHPVPEKNPSVRAGHRRPADYPARPAPNCEEYPHRVSTWIAVLPASLQQIVLLPRHLGTVLPRLSCRG